MQGVGLIGGLAAAETERLGRHVYGDLGGVGAGGANRGLDLRRRHLASGREGPGLVVDFQDQRAGGAEAKVGETNEALEDGTGFDG